MPPAQRTKGALFTIGVRSILAEAMATFIFMISNMGFTVNWKLMRLPLCTATLTTDCFTSAEAARFDAMGSGFAAIGNGFCAVAVIYSFAGLSGAHFNPAVTLAAVIRGKLDIIRGLCYWGVQVGAAFLALWVLDWMTPGTPAQTLVLMQPAKPTPTLQFTEWNYMVAEAIMTFVLIYTVFATVFGSLDDQVRVADDGSRQGRLTIYTTSGGSAKAMAPLAIGFAIGFLGFIGGNISGSAYNPARVLAPVIFTGQFTWDNCWMYLCADFTGAALAAMFEWFFSPTAQNGKAFLAIWRFLCRCTCCRRVDSCCGGDSEEVLSAEAADVALNDLVDYQPGPGGEVHTGATVPAAAPAKAGTV